MPKQNIDERFSNEAVKLATLELLGPKVPQKPLIILLSPTRNMSKSSGWKKENIPVCLKLLINLYLLVKRQTLFVLTRQDVHLILQSYPTKKVLVLLKASN